MIYDECKNCGLRRSTCENNDSPSEWIKNCMKVEGKKHEFDCIACKDMGNGEAVHEISHTCGIQNRCKKHGVVHRNGGYKSCPKVASKFDQAKKLADEGAEKLSALFDPPSSSKEIKRKEVDYSPLKPNDYSPLISSSKGWQDTFIQKFVYFDGISVKDGANYRNATLDEIKSFISQTLLSERQKLVEEVEGLKRDWEHAKAWGEGWNIALDEVIKILKK